MAILATKLKNAFNKYEDKDKYSMSFKNVSVNGDKRGCYGFITNLENDVCVCINTEQTSMNLGMFYRYCEQQGEHTGGINHFAHSLEEIVENTRKMLENPQQAENELASWGKHYQGNEPVKRKKSNGLDEHGNHKPAVSER